MKLAVCDTHTYDRDALAAANGRYAHAVTFFEPRLTRRTASRATGFPAVYSFVNDRVEAGTLAILQAGGTRLIALRSAGDNHVDLDEAGRRGVVVVRVPEYSPHAVAEHTVGLILAPNRKIHRAYNRVREPNFLTRGIGRF
jgi:D-lactate dehydrogenase